MAGEIRPEVLNAFKETFKRKFNQEWPVGNNPTESPGWSWFLAGWNLCDGEDPTVGEFKEEEDV